MQDNDSSDPGELVRIAREAKGWSQTKLGEAVGTNQQTIGKIEKGKIKHSSFFFGISRELAIPLDRLIPDAAEQAQQPQIPLPDPIATSKDLPVFAAAQGGPGEMIVSTDPVDWVLRPGPLANVARSYGVIVIGESMLPEFRPGDIALVNPHLPPMRDETYIFYAERDGEARATIKRLARWTDTAWVVQQWNPPKGQKQEFQLPRREWGKLHRVVGKYSR